MTELSPCPFCGSQPELNILYEEDEIDGVVIRCAKCGISKEKLTVEAGTNWWNARHAQCALPSHDTVARILQNNMRDKSGCFVGWETCYVAAKAVIDALISTSNEPTKPRAYYVEHPMLGLKLSLDQPSEEAIERGWVATPLYALTSMNVD